MSSSPTYRELFSVKNLLNIDFLKAALRIKGNAIHARMAFFMRMVGTGPATFVQRKQLLVCVVIPRLAIGTHSTSAACHQAKHVPEKVEMLFAHLVKLFTGHNPAMVNAEKKSTLSRQKLRASSLVATMTVVTMPLGS